MRQMLIVFTMAFHLFVGSNAFAQQQMQLESTYSRGNDDYSETNHETAKIKLTLVVTASKSSNLTATLFYEGIFSVDHPHNSMSENYWLKQITNSMEPNLTIAKFSYEPGPDGTSLQGRVSGEISLGEIFNPGNGPLRGRLAVTMLPYFDPSDLRPIDSWIDWGVMIENGLPVLGNLSMFAQWKGDARPSEEMLRLISSNFIDPSHFRLPFPPKGQRVH